MRYWQVKPVTVTRLSFKRCPISAIPITYCSGVRIAFLAALSSRRRMQEPPEPDPSWVGAQYVNYFEIGYNAFEFLFDFAQAHDDQVAPSVHNRMITAPVYAKLLSTLLAESIHQYEEKFGQIPETGGD